jgi:hypothetical protein
MIEKMLENSNSPSSSVGRALHLMERSEVRALLAGLAKIFPELFFTGYGVNMSKFHVRYKYTNLTAGLKLPAKGRGDHVVVLPIPPAPGELHEAVRQRLLEGMLAQGWTENVIDIIDVVPIED